MFQIHCKITQKEKSDENKHIFELFSTLERELHLSFLLSVLQQNDVFFFYP